MIKEIGLTTLILLISATSICAQDYLKIVGKYDYTKVPESYLLKVNLNKLTIREIHQIDSSLTEIELNFTIDSTNQLIAKILHRDWNRIDNTNETLIKSNLRKSTKYYYPIKEKESEDILAIKAIENANNKVSVLSFILNRKIKRILNIDDVTPKYLTIYDEGVYSSCIKQNADIIIDYIYGEQKVGITEFDENEIHSTYFIYVTYELE